MCYSAMVWAEYKAYVNVFGAEISIHEYFELFVRRASGEKISVPKALEHSFADPKSDTEREIKAMIDAHNAALTTQLQQELFALRKRSADAERKLQVKPTKKAQEDVRIAGNKTERARARLADLERTMLKPRDSRIYPGYYAPVMVWQDGKRVVRPMRYQCRPCGKPAFYDTKYPGTYNARRDNLEGFWKGQFGHTHGLMVVNAFYEHVTRPGPNGEDENTILEFSPTPKQDMLVACVGSQGEGEGGPLLSFAAITDEPPPEVAAAGHDRCIIPIKPENIDAWLQPERHTLAELYAILDDRERPYYEHRLAA
jgi:putative SOS response-associated peptidase YedK